MLQRYTELFFCMEAFGKTAKSPLALDGVLLVSRSVNQLCKLLAVTLIEAVELGSTSTKMTYQGVTALTGG